MREIAELTEACNRKQAQIEKLAYDVGYWREAARHWQERAEQAEAEVRAERKARYDALKV